MPTPQPADVYPTLGTLAQQLAHLATGPAPDYTLVRHLLRQLNEQFQPLARLRVSGPPPANPRPWHEVLGLTPDATRQQVMDRYWHLGSRGPVPLPVLNQAYDAALVATEPCQFCHGRGARSIGQGPEYCSECGLSADSPRALAPTCKRPPRGWVCSRPPGHAGPCAADTARPRQELAEALNVRYGCQLTADDILDFMVTRGSNEVQVQADRDGFIDWYSIQTDAAGQLLPATIEQLPF